MTADSLNLADFDQYGCVKAVFRKPMEAKNLATVIDGLIGDSEPTGEM